MERYSNSTREVAQDGRRGALMLTVKSSIPRHLKFIDAKLVEGKVTGAMRGAYRRRLHTGGNLRHGI